MIYKFLQAWLGEKPYRLSLVTILGIGIFLRLRILTKVDFNFPYTLGGLFLEFAEQIVENEFRLPISIPYYSSGGIPFAYPPLPFYLLGVLIHFTSISKFMLLNLLPPIIAILTLIVFWFTAKELLINRKSAMFATGVFCLMPSAYLELVESAGLAEAMGMLTIVGFIFCLSKFSKFPGYPWTIVCVFSWGLAFCSSPGALYGSILIFLLFNLFLILELRGNYFKHYLRFMLLIGSLTVMVTAPYWYIVVKNHGSQIFINAFLAQQSNVPFAINFRNTLSHFLGDFNISRAYTHFLFDAVIFFGLGYSLIAKRWFFAFMLIVFYSIPREGLWLSAIPGAILAGLILGDVIVPWLEIFSNRNFNSTSRNKLAVAGLIIGLFLIRVNNQNVLDRIRTDNFSTVYESEHWRNFVTAMEAFHGTDESLRELPMVIIARNGFTEWAANLSKMTVLNVPYGLEWQPLEHKVVSEFNDAVSECTNFACVSLAADNYFQTSKFVLIIEDGFIEMKSEGGTQNNYTAILIHHEYPLSVYQVTSK